VGGHGFMTLGMLAVTYQLKKKKEKESIGRL